MTGLSLMFLLPVSSWSFLAMRNCCSCSSLTALRRVATFVFWGVEGGRGSVACVSLSRRRPCASQLPTAFKPNSTDDPLPI